MSNLITHESIGADIMLAAEIGYWAEGAEITAEGDLIIRGDYDAGTDTTFPVVLTAEEIGRTHDERLFHRGGIKGVHESNYAWIKQPDDYDADSGDWVIQHLIYGEVIFG